jgi:hypothetical protein
MGKKLKRLLTIWQKWLEPKQTVNPNPGQRQWIAETETSIGAIPWAFENFKSETDYENIMD